MAHHGQELAFGPIRILRRFLGNQQLLLFGDILNDNIKAYLCMIDDDRRNGTQDFNRVAVLMVDQINVLFIPAMLYSITKHCGNMVVPDDDADIHAGQFRNFIPRQLTGLFIAVDNITLQIQ
ncbi:hypothetical protein D3C73_997140 [compost metagenome]